MVLEAKKLADAKTAFYKAEHRQLKINSSDTTNAPSITRIAQPKGRVIDLEFIETTKRYCSENADNSSPSSIKQFLKLCKQVRANLKLSLKTDNGLSGDNLRSIPVKNIVSSRFGTNLLEVCEKVSLLNNKDRETYKIRTARSVINELISLIEHLQTTLAQHIGINTQGDLPPSDVHSDIVPRQLLPVGNEANKVESITRPSASSAQPNEKNAPKISRVLEECLTEKKRGTISIAGLRSSVGLLIEWFGEEQPISFYTREKNKNLHRRMPA